jgi:hypothetical protein
MTAQPSQTRIVNKALSHLGSTKRITSITDGTPQAKLADAFWDECRDEVLADHPWNFAIARADLPASANYTPPNEYDFAYELPPGCLRWLPWREDHADYFDGVQEGPYILANADAPIFIRYITRIEDLAKWSPGFMAAMAAKLARYMAKGVTGQSGMIAAMEDLYQDSLSLAKRQDGLATGRRTRTAEYRSSWLDARNRGVTR